MHRPDKLSLAVSAVLLVVWLALWIWAGGAPTDAPAKGDGLPVYSLIFGFVIGMFADCLIDAAREADARRLLESDETPVQAFRRLTGCLRTAAPRAVL